MRLKSITFILASTALLIAMCASNSQVSAANQSGKLMVDVKVIPDPNACGGSRIRTKPLIPRVDKAANVLAWQSTDGPMTITFDDTAITATCSSTADPQGHYTCTSSKLTNSTADDLDYAYGIVVKTSKGDVREDPVIIVRPGS